MKDGMIGVLVIALLIPGDSEIGADVVSFILMLNGVVSLFGSGFAGVSTVIEAISEILLGLFSVPNLEESEMFAG